MRYPIYLNYDPAQQPIGFVDINEGTLKEIVHEGVILPKLSSAGDGAPFELISFGLVLRTTVDKRSRKL